MSSRTVQSRKFWLGNGMKEVSFCFPPYYQAFCGKAAAPCTSREDSPETSTVHHRKCAACAKEPHTYFTDIQGFSYRQERLEREIEIHVTLNHTDSASTWRNDTNAQYWLVKQSLFYSVKMNWQQNNKLIKHLYTGVGRSRLIVVCERVHSRIIYLLVRVMFVLLLFLIPTYDWSFR